MNSKRKIIINLIKGCFIGLSLVVVAFLFIAYMMKSNPYYEFLLITKSETTHGFITHSEEFEDYAEQEGHSGRVFYNIYFDYTFTTKNGQIIKDHSSDASPESGYLSAANEKPIPIEVEYLPNKPKINRIKGMTGQGTSIGDFIWRRVGLGLLLLLGFSSIGFMIIKKAIKEFKIERNKLATAS